MYSLQLRKHPNIFSEKEKDQSFFEEAKLAVSGASEAMGSDIVDKLKARVENAEKSTNKSTQDTLKILKATGALIDIGAFNILNKISLAKRWGEGSGKIGAQKIIEALDKAEKGETQIVTYSNNTYESWSLKEYENQVNTNTGFMNVSAMKGLYSLRGSGAGFEESTWKKIGLYIYGRNGDTNLVRNLSKEEIDNLLELGKKAKEDKEKSIQTELQKVWEKPEMRKVLEKRGILVGNKLDIKKELDTLKQANAPIASIEKHFDALADNLKKEAKILLNESKEEAKRANLDKKSFSDIGITDIFVMGEDGKRVNISKSGISTISDIYAGDALLAANEWINKRDKNSPNYAQDLKNFEAIQRTLTKKIEAFRKVDDATKAHLVAVKAREDGTRGINGRDFAPPTDKLLDQAGEIGKARLQHESIESALRELGINNPDEARRRLHKLWEKETETDLTPKEEYEKRVLEESMNSNKRVAMSYGTAVHIFGEEDAKRIFTESNRFVSENPKETYNFESLEKTAIMNNPESTHGEKRLVGLKPGESMPLEQILERRDSIGNYHVPEIVGTELLKNQDGTYSIKGALKAENLTKKEMQEYMKDIRMYVDVGLSQFIPLLPTITKELQKLGINTALDGQTGTMEQQNVLKALHKCLFGREPETSDLEVVKKSFKEKLGQSPSSMRNTMQGILLHNKLIDTYGGAIKPDNLQRWLHDAYSTPPNYPPL